MYTFNILNHIYWNKNKSWLYIIAVNLTSWQVAVAILEVLSENEKKKPAFIQRERVMQILKIQNCDVALDHVKISTGNRCFKWIVRE